MYKYLFLIVAPFLFACTSSDKNENNNVTNTFLENYQGTKWYASNDNGHDYQRFLTDSNSPIEVWIYSTVLNPDDCYYYFLYTFSDLEPGETIEITENLDNVFEYRYTYYDGDNDENVSLTTYNVSGNTMQAEHKHYLNGTLDLSEIVIWTKSGDEVDNLSICN